MSTQKNRRRTLTPSQTYDVWELPSAEEIKEEAQKVIKPLEFDTDEAEKTIVFKKENKNGS